MEPDKSDIENFNSRPKRSRCDSSRCLFNSNSDDNKLELSGILSVLKEYDDYGGGINCRICGKLYRSKVCFTKHLWEHSVYWEMFEGAKNHERVLSIQAAIILWNHHQGNNSGNHDNQLGNNTDLASLVVTSPQKKEKDTCSNNNLGFTDLDKPIPIVLKSSTVDAVTPKKSSNRQKKRRLPSNSDIIVRELSTMVPPHSDLGSPAKMTRQC